MTYLDMFPLYVALRSQTNSEMYPSQEADCQQACGLLTKKPDLQKAPIGFYGFNLIRFKFVLLQQGNRAGEKKLKIK